MKKVEHEYFIRVNSVNSCSFKNIKGFMKKVKHEYFYSCEFG